MFNSHTDVLVKLVTYEGNQQITVEELDFIYLRMTKGPRKNYAFGTLPYVTPAEKNLADSIAKKLRLNKFYRGPRHASARRYGQPCRTWKEDATGVALYRK